VSFYNVVLEATKLAGAHEGIRTITAYNSKAELDLVRNQRYGEGRKNIIVAEGITNDEAQRLASMTSAQAHVRVAMERIQENPLVKEFELGAAAFAIAADARDRLGRKQSLDTQTKYYVVIEYTEHSGAYAGTRYAIPFSSKADFELERDTYGADQKILILAEGLSQKDARVLTALTPAEARLRVASFKASESNSVEAGVRAFSQAMHGIRTDAEKILNTPPAVLLEALWRIDRG
jgi:hypothetical protein